jgi:hypothetical protein
VDYVKRAEHALRTGQPRLAELYMRRGLSESAAGRSWLIWHDFRAGLDRFGREAVVILRAVGLAEPEPGALTQAAYALGGPSKGVPYGGD